MDFIIPGRPDKWEPEMHGLRDPLEVPVTYTGDTQEAVDIIGSLNGTIAMDTETVYTPGKVDPLTAQLRVISIATEDADGKDISYVFDVRDMDLKALGQAFQNRASELGQRKLQVLGFNANFDDPVTTLAMTDQNVSGGTAYRPLFDWVDLMFAVSLPRLGAAGHSWPSLAKSAKRYLGVDMDGKGKGTTQLSYDADTDLAEDQVNYAAMDAVVTLWLGDAVHEPLKEQDLLEAFTLETTSRAFLSSMTINGLKFDREGWMSHLDEVNQDIERILGEIAEITGGQATLFGSATPSFNPDSSKATGEALNEFCPEVVAEYMVQVEGVESKEDLKRPASLQPYDSVDKNALKLMKVYGDRMELDTTLVDLLLQYSGVSKLRSTYGEKMMRMLDEHDRFHSEYTQCLIATGRTSSSKPNAQNFSPLMKKFFKPAPRVDENGVEHERVLLHADYSQAELRVSAQLTGEPTRRDAFASDDDQHAVVAGAMFNVNMDELQESEEGKARYKSLRSRAKTINFGLNYGMREGLLANTLTQQGIPTTKQEAAKLIDDFFVALPTEAKWLNNRDERVHRMAREVKLGLERGSMIDFDLSLRLHKLKKITAQQTRSLKKAGQPVSIEDIAASYVAGESFATGEEREDYKRSLVKHLEWASKYDTAVVLRTDGSTYEFFSKTLAKRRRVFQVQVSHLLENLAFTLGRPRTPGSMVSVDRWASDHNVELAHNPHQFNRQTGEPIQSKRRRNLSFSELKKRFEKIGTEMREDFVHTMLKEASTKPPVKVDTMAQEMPRDKAIRRDALSRNISKQANAYRNAPIQGSVADAVLRAFADLDKLFDKYPTAMPVLTVHDSIVVECDIEESAVISKEMEALMEQALQAYIPDVKVVADLDVMRSLDEADIIPTEELPARD